MMFSHRGVSVSVSTEATPQHAPGKGPRSQHAARQDPHPRAGPWLATGQPVPAATGATKVREPHGGHTA